MPSNYLEKLNPKELGFPALNVFFELGSWRVSCAETDAPV
jgi:hypothetical protein